MHMGVQPSASGNGTPHSPPSASSSSSSSSSEEDAVDESNSSASSAPSASSAASPTTSSPLSLSDDSGGALDASRSPDSPLRLLPPSCSLRCARRSRPADDREAPSSPSSSAVSRLRLRSAEEDDADPASASASIALSASASSSSSPAASSSLDPCDSLPPSDPITSSTSLSISAKSICDSRLDRRRRFVFGLSGALRSAIGVTVADSGRSPDTDRRLVDLLSATDAFLSGIITPIDENTASTTSPRPRSPPGHCPRTPPSTEAAAPHSPLQVPHCPSLQSLAEWPRRRHRPHCRYHSPPTHPFLPLHHPEYSCPPAHPQSRRRRESLGRDHHSTPRLCRRRHQSHRRRCQNHRRCQWACVRAVPGRSREDTPARPPDSAGRSMQSATPHAQCTCHHS
eukprot:Opistho-2@5485